MLKKKIKKDLNTKDAALLAEKIIGRKVMLTNLIHTVQNICTTYLAGNIGKFKDSDIKKLAKWCYNFTGGNYV